MAKLVEAHEIGAPHIQNLIDKMIKTMRHHNGVGLAAPQVGLSIRVIVLESSTSPLRVIVNPTISPIGEAQTRAFEGCLSIPGYRGRVDRFKNVLVTGFERDGSHIEFRAAGYEARILQHECDHLDGIVYTDRLTNFLSFRSTSYHYDDDLIEEDVSNLR